MWCDMILVCRTERSILWFINYVLISFNIYNINDLSPIYENGVCIWNGGHFEKKMLSLKMPQNDLYGVPLDSKTILKFSFT